MVLRESSHESLRSGASCYKSLLYRLEVEGSGMEKKFEGSSADEAKGLIGFEVLFRWPSWKLLLPWVES